MFLEYFKDFAIIPDRNVHLTVVYYGSSGLGEIKRCLSDLNKSTGFTDFVVANIANESFSRGRGNKRFY